MMVSGNRKIERKIPPQDWQPVRMAVISMGSHGARCSCGWTSRQITRVKVLDNVIDRHLAKRHEGRGIRI
jgi:hypothetical protein